MPHIGIDFGTTNSAMVAFTPRRSGFRPFDLIGDYDGNPFPSVVGIDRLTHKATCGRVIKDSIEELLATGSHLIVPSIKSALETEAQWLLGTKTWTAQNIATELFRALTTQIQNRTKTSVEEAVVAIPVGMAVGKRRQIRAAAEQAGIRVTTFISEPTAAFIANAEQLRHCKYVAVFDWGGGTLDLCILEVRGKCIMERYADGWDVAGDYIDRKLAEWMHARIAEENGFDFSFDAAEPRDRQILLDRAEQIKRQLQESSKVTINIPYGTKNCELTIQQEDVDDIVRPIVDEAVAKLFRCIEKAKISEKEIGALLVVGGSSRLWLLKEKLNVRWPHPNILFPDDADWAVAKGAAVLAANPGCYRLADGIGLILADDRYHSIFGPQTAIQENMQETLHFGLVEDSPTATFVFATESEDEPKRRHNIGELSVNSFGFRDETIALKSTITPDLVFLAEARSEFKDSRTKKTFAFEHTRMMYEIPEGLTTR